MGWDREEKQNRILGELLKGVQREVRERLADLLLQDSLQVTQYLKLPLKEQRQQVGRPQTAKVFQLPAQTRAIEVFTREDVARRLLILGEPGSGKSTTLLQLAEELIEEAEVAARRNNSFQLPVIFELSDWTNKKQSLEQWLIAQLNDNYTIDEQISQKWLEKEQILPLLDGLDELGLPRQRSAIEAINLYLKQDISRRLVVCCRWQEYRQGNKKLNQLHGAYYLQPPRDSEIRDYLERFGQERLWSEIESNPLMKELAQKPLFLNLMIPAFRGEAILNEAKLFENYIANKLNPDNHDSRKYPQGVPYTEEETKHWLTYLARHLEADSLTVFLIEKIQPYWLNTGIKRLAFRLIYGLFFGLIAGLVFGLSGRLVFASVSGLITGVIAGITFGLVSGLIFWEFIEYELNAEAFILEWEAISKDLITKLITKLITGLIYGLIFGLIVGLIYGLIFGLIYGLIIGLIYGLIYGLIAGLIYGLKTEIKTREVSNQGIKEAAKKSLIIPIITLPFFSLIVPLASVATGVTFTWEGCIGMGFCLAMTVGLLTGGEDWIQHLALRLILSWQNKIPGNYAKFLDYAAERRLLQKTGGRYRFLHDSLRKHFCGNSPPPSHTIEITKNQWLGYVLLFFSSFSILILNSSIYPVNSNRSSLVTPIVQTHDVTLSDLITYRWRNYQRGDIIDIRSNEFLVEQGFNEDLQYIMRIVGLPEESWEIKKGQIYINGQLLSADYLDNYPIKDYDQIKRKVPASQYLVIGKSYTQKEESLVATLVSKEDILGRVIFRILPLERWGAVK